MFTSILQILPSAERLRKTFSWLPTVVLATGFIFSLNDREVHSLKVRYENTQVVHLVYLCDYNEHVCPHITDDKLTELEQYLPQLFEKNYQFIIDKIFVRESYMNPHVMLEASSLYRENNNISQTEMVGFISLLSERFQGWAGRMEDENTFFVTIENNPNAEKVIAHEIGHLEGLKHTCDFIKPDPYDIGPYLSEMEKCKETRTDLMHPSSCPDVKKLEDCDYDLNRVFTPEDYESYHREKSEQRR